MPTNMRILKNACKPALGIFLSAIILMGVGVFAGDKTGSDTASVSTKPLRVLFIGNSYIYVNMLPEMLQQFSVAGKQCRPLEYRMVVPGGYSLQQHWTNGTALHAIAEGGWDYVVLQEQSLLPVTDSTNMFYYARLFDQEVRKTGGKTVFYTTWARKSAPDKQEQITAAYSAIAKELNALIAPVGPAWAKVLKQRPNLEMYQVDGSHPSSAGTYLAACVFYNVLYGASPAGLPGTVVGKKQDGKVDTLVALSEEDASLLQQTARQTVQEWGRFEVVKVDSQALKNNVLHDPALRSAVVFFPEQATNGQPLPILYYLPGFNTITDEFIKHPVPWLRLTQKIANEITPMILVVVDGYTRWGGSQYLNSTAQGNYADYVCDEIIAAVEKQHPVPGNGLRRILAGHSSGGFGALRLGMARQSLFDGVIALSPDSDFNVSHLPLVKTASASNTPLAEITRIAQSQAPAPNGDLNYLFALSAAYAPCDGSHPGQFEWIYDAQGKFRPEIWQRWLDNDPLTLILKDSHAFGANQAIYFEGAAHDEFLANIGARKMFEAMKNSSNRCVFYEPPGGHGDHLYERLQRGLAWLFQRPVSDIK